MNPADQPRPLDPFAGASAQQPQTPPTPADDTAELSVPEANQRRWSGKKTAVVAAMAIGLASAGAAGASAAVPLGSNIGGGSDSRHFGPGGGFPGRFERGSMPNGAGFGGQAPGQSQSQTQAQTQGQTGQTQGQTQGQVQGQPGQAPTGQPPAWGQGGVPTKPASATN